MKVLVLIRDFGEVGPLEGVLRSLAARGHAVHIMADLSDDPGAIRLAEAVARDHPAVTFGFGPSIREDAWLELGRVLRICHEHLRSPASWAGGMSRGELPPGAGVPPRFARLAARPIMRRRTPAGVLRACLDRLERARPIHWKVYKSLRSYRPDVVVATAALDFDTRQLDWLRAAKGFGVRTALCVSAWDDLFAKDSIRDLPDVVMVWNERQRVEAVERHGVPPERVTVVGAARYDRWFEWKGRAREDFCQRVGLRPDRPYIVYVASATLREGVAERELVGDWLRRLRALSEARGRDAGVLIRPHPAYLKLWRKADFSELGKVVVWPLATASPVDAQSEAEYFESVYHSAAVVGLPTSVLVEAVIVGRPVYVMAPLADATDGVAPFFEELWDGGVLRQAASTDEHLRQLAETLAGGGDDPPGRRRVLERVLRPHGIGVPAAPVVVAGIERLGQVGPGRAEKPTRWWSYPVRLLLVPKVVGIGLSAGAGEAQEGWGPRLRHKTVEYVLTRRRVRAAVKRHVLPHFVKVEVAAVKASRQHTDGSMGWDQVSAGTVREAILRLARSGKPVIAGPWLTEVGFELLYWIPFLAWAKAFGGLDAERLIVVSRGGAAPWYRHITGHYEDVLAYFTPEEFARKNAQWITLADGIQKQNDVSAFDHEILKRVKAARKLSDAEVLHPSLMHGLFRAYWREQSSTGLIDAFTSYRLLPKPDRDAAGRAWPDRYVAVKFYSNPSFPGDEVNRAFVQSLLRRLAGHTDVVLLGTGLHLDDHAEFEAPRSERVHTIDRLVTPRDNLEVQTRVISQASAFVGTYGGFAYLAPFYRIPTVSFYSHSKRFLSRHLELARRVFENISAGPFVTLDVRDVGVLSAVLMSAADVERSVP